jgi:uncharacterized membrane protein YfcA
VAPASLATTAITSVVGTIAFLVLDVTGRGAAPLWSLGLVCGVGGLLGGYVGGRLQPRLPEVLLVRLVGLLAAGLGIAYLLQALL